MKYKVGQKFIASSPEWNEVYNVEILSVGNTYSLSIVQINGPWRGTCCYSKDWLDEYCVPESKLHKVLA